MTASAPPLSRRHFLTSTAVAGAAALSTSASARAGTPKSDKYVYEIQRTDEEWRAMLSKDEYKILREGDTELPHTSPLVEITEEGTYTCKGCDLPVFRSEWKAPIDKGWVFFAHAVETSVLTSIDGPQRAYGMNPNGLQNLIEIHCRRCGSHLGHHLIVSGEMLYCINGTAMNFTAASA